ncbi:hypothetical protein [Kitasatospora sp. NPDC097643]|uniref:CIS tube protein n=1 Tax=Kitasatospora sp. NPDC097643 TaxID=3157230 RepID=UPI003322DA97
MPELAHATLQRLAVTKAATKDQPPVVKGEGPVVEVQFNPVSLRLSRNNNVDRGGTSTRTQKRQNPAQEGATLSFDLAFDTAEQGGPGEYVDVRDWTAVVRQFVEPPPKKKGDPPPVVRFVWGPLRFNGIVTQVNEELDLFAPDGTPLRAKVAVTIAEQNFTYEANETGAGRRDARAATDPGAARPGSTPGTAGTARPQQLAQAQAGESAQQLLARLGLDPAAWRGAMRGLDSPLSLTAGFNVQLGVEVEAGGSVGLSAGFAGEVAATSVAGLAGALGLGVDGVPPGGGPAGGGVGGGGAAGVGAGGDIGTAVAGVDAATAAGFALSAGGGIAASVNTVVGARAALAVDQARGAFAVPAGGSTGGTAGGSAGGMAPGRPGAAGPAGSTYGGRPPAADPTTPAAPLGTDPRALTYGRGVPLRSRADPGTLAEVTAGGALGLTGRARAQETPQPDGVTPPWERLPPVTPARLAADCEQRRRDAPPSTLRWRPPGGGRP